MPSLSRNSDYQWARFDSEAYFQHYYGKPHPDDDHLIHSTVEAIKQAPLPGAKLDFVDVGTGPNLIPLLCVLPKARKLTVWEYAESNIAWLEAELRRKDMRPQWKHFWQVTREAYNATWQLPEDPIPMLRAKCELKKGSVFGLPERTWDAATMFFCAESITARHDEFEAACSAFARCVRAGGALIATFLVRSEGYVVADHSFPVLRLSVETIERVFRRDAQIMKAEQIGLVKREIRSGYSGFVFLAGLARQRARSQNGL